VRARAFTLGQNIVFGADQYAPGTAEGKRLLAHELTHTIQQRTGSLRPAVQRDTIDDVRKKLSYGIIDWAITDSEAMEALALLGTIAPANLANELVRLGSKYVTRLLDNLPDAAKTGDIYRRVVAAAGSAGVAPYVKELLSTGLFDWAITDAEVGRVYNAFTHLPAAAKEQLLDDLNTAKRLGDLIDNSNTGHHALYIRPWISTLTRGRFTPRQRKIVRTIVENTSDDAKETLKLATETRFNVTVGRATVRRVTPVEWKPGHLRQAYLVLDELPEAHVARNRELLRLGQFKQAAAGGYITAGKYSPTQRELAINVEESDIRETALHEIGHAVDERMGWSSGPEPARPTRGGWTIYRADYRRCAGDMVTDSGGAISALPNAQRTAVIAEMATAMGNRRAAGLKRAIRNLAWFGGLAAATQKAVLADKALKAIKVGLNEPWFKAKNGGEHLGDHTYQESYRNLWVRYDHAARARKVSKYQFRGPRDWFAEAYMYYYLPDKRGRGAKLNDKDRDTKTYFDNTVHRIGATR